MMTSEWYKILFLAIGAAWAIITMVVAATEGKKDDAVVKVILDIASALQAKNAAGTLKMPGTRSRFPDSPDTLYIQRIREDGAVVNTKSTPPEPMQ